MIGAVGGLLGRELEVRRDRASGFDRAVWCLLLREPDGGLDAVRAAINDPFPTGDAHIGLASRWQRARLSLVAGDLATAARAAEVEGWSSSYLAGYREYVAAMLALARGDQRSAEQEVERLSADAAGRAKLRSGHPAALAEIPRGILFGDAAAVAAGIDALLRWHLRRARARSEIFNSAHAMVCLDAVAALVLADQRGVGVEVAAVHRAAVLPMLVLHVREWEDRPLPHAMRVDVTTDLVAGLWLDAAGLRLGAAVPAEPPRRRVRPRTRPRPADAPPQAAIEELRRRLSYGVGAPWQVASWSLMVGDPVGGRRALSLGAPQSVNAWETFGYVLVTGDESERRVALSVLGEARRSFERFSEPYAHVSGYLDVIADLIAPAGVVPTRADVHRAHGPLAGVPVACAGLAEHDAALLTTGLTTMLDEHAHALERRSSPPPPVCAPAVHFAIAARHLGIEIDLDARHRAHAVPIAVPTASPGGRVTGRLSCDLLGADLWT